MNQLEIRVNGATFPIEGVDPHQSLLHFLRERGLTGTKEGCAEGECGACAVVMVRRDVTGKVRYVPVNSCLVLAGTMVGQELITVEGVAEGGLHPVQEAMIEHGGSQCGYCTPGFVMSMFAEYYREERAEGDYDPEAIGGNLCRCTGYRPIRDALVSLKVPGKEDPRTTRLQAAAPAAKSVDFTEDGVFFARPTDLEGVFSAMARCPSATLIGGGTDVVVGINQFEQRHEGFIALEGVSSLRTITEDADGIRIGAGVPLSEVEQYFHQHALSIFDELFVLFSSRLIRNRATLGGNLVNASPIGDSPPALLALGASVELAKAGADGVETRSMPLNEFFTGYRQTVLTPGELLSAVCIPKPFPDLMRFYKVSKRVMDDISTVAAGFGVWRDEEGQVTRAHLAYGGVAATPVRAEGAEALLVGQLLAPRGDVMASLEAAFSPIGDHRGSADYRAQMVGRLFEKFCASVEADRDQEAAQ